MMTENVTEKNDKSHTNHTEISQDTLEVDHKEQAVFLAHATVITSKVPDRLTKTFRREEGGELIKEGGGNLVDGIAAAITVSNLEEFRKIILGLSTNQALVYGHPKELPVNIVTKDTWVKLKKPDNPQPRARESFMWSDGPGVMMLDYDPRGSEDALTSDQLVKFLQESVPGLSGVEMLTIPSSSSHIFDTQTGDDLTGLRGQRVYLLVDNAKRIPKLGRWIVDYLWAADHGYILISGAGSQLERTIVDAAVWQPERLDFAAGAHCKGYLEQRRGDGIIYPGDSEFLDTSLIPEPSKDIIGCVSAAKAKAKLDTKEEATRFKTAWVETYTNKTVGKSATTEQRERAVKEALQAVEGCELTGTFPIIIRKDDEEVTVTVDQILASPEQYDEFETLDPFEPEYRDRSWVGKLYLSNDSPNLHSFAHGGRTCKLMMKGDNGINRLLLPGKGTPAIIASRSAGKLLSKTGKYYRREGGALYRIEMQKRDIQALKQVIPASFISELEQYAEVGGTNKNGEFEQKTCTEAQARTILASPAFIKEIPRVSILCASPVLTCKNDKPIMIVGYDPDLEILVLDPSDRGGQSFTIKEAKKKLLCLLNDYDFATKADLSRTIAMLITPALIQGELIKGRAPLFVIEADKSQAGKGILVKIFRAIYREKGKYLTQRNKGVGSLDEDYCAALATATPFIIFDNIRGRFESQLIESGLTENFVFGRGAHQKNQELDPTKVMHVLISNNAELNRDMANRACFISIKKRPNNYEFKSFSEGDVLDHCQHNQASFLKAVHTIIAEWILQGCPLTKETRHDRRPWCRAVDWIVQKIFDLPPVMDNHDRRKHRATDKKLTWLRKVAITVCEVASDTWLPTAQILQLIEENEEIEIPGCKDRELLDKDDTWSAACQGIGRSLSSLFKKWRKNETIELDGYSVTRRDVEKKYDSSNGPKKIREYLFLPVGVDA